MPVDQLRALRRQDSGPRRPDPARLPAPPVAADRPGRRLPDRRLALLARHPRLREFAARNRLPHRLHRPGDGRRRRGARCATLGIRPDETPVVFSAGTRSCATRATPNSPALVGLAVPRRPAAVHLRPRRRRRRPGRAGRRRLRRVRRAARPRVLDAVATGGQAATVVPHRELPRLPGRHLRRRAGRAGGDPGREVRRRTPGTRRGDQPGATPTASYVVRLDDGEPCHRPHRPRRHRRPLPQARRAPARGVRGIERLLRGHGAWRRGRAGTTRSAVVGGGNSAGQAALFLAEHARCGAAAHPWRRPRPTCPATSPTGSTRTAGSRCSCTPRCASWSATDTLDAIVVEDRPHRRAPPPGRPCAVRLHRRGSLHGLARLANWPSTRTASSSPVRRTPTSSSGPAGPPPARDQPAGRLRRRAT